MRLIADIGGTNARFAMADRDGVVHGRAQLAVANHARFEDALAAYLSTTELQPTCAALSVAGPVVDNSVEMTNTPWKVSDYAVHAVCPGIPVKIVNDLRAVALAIPDLDPQDFLVLHAGSSPRIPAPHVCINVGTGFGAAVVLPQTGRWDALATEAGHMTLAMTGADERVVLGDDMTLEGVFSGPGLQRLRSQLAVKGVAPDVFRQTYSHVLGRVAGDLALATGAWGGIEFCGGVMDAFDGVIDLESLLAGLHTRHGLARRLESVPVRRIICADPAFTGLTHMAL